MHTRTCAHQGIRNVSFSENFVNVQNGQFQNKCSTDLSLIKIWQNVKNHRQISVLILSEIKRID